MSMRSGSYRASPHHRRIVALTTVLAMWALLAPGCAPLNTDDAEAKRALQFGHDARENGDLTEATRYYELVLKQSPKSYDAAMALADCQVELAGRASLPSQRNELLHSAIEHFENAAKNATTSSARAAALLQLGRQLDQLEDHAHALEVYTELAAITDSDRSRVALAHVLIGEQLLRTLHGRHAIDAEIEPTDTEALTLVDRARVHFDECLELAPNDYRALLGRGIALLHSSRPRLAEQALSSAISTIDAVAAELETTSTPASADAAGGDDNERTRKRATLDEARLRAHFLRGVAVEHRIGKNPQSKQAYLDALDMPGARRFSAVNRRLVDELIEQPQLFDEQERGRIVAHLLRFEGNDNALWRRTLEYLNTLTTPTRQDRLARAVASGRIDDSAKAYESFVGWFESGPVPDDCADVIELIFRAPPGATDPVRSARRALAQSRAHRLLIPSGDYPRRKRVWDSLRSSIERVQGLKSESARRVHLDLLNHFAIELYENRELDNDPQQALREAHMYCSTETNQSPTPHEAIYRLGLIRKAEVGGDYEIEYARRVIESDKSKSYAPAYRVVAAAYRKHGGGQDSALVAQLEDLLRTYRGDEQDILSVKQQILDKAQRAKQAAEAQRAQELAEKQRLQEEAKYKTCPHCLLKIKRTATVCRHCGSNVN